MTAQIQYDGGLTVSLPVSDLDAAINWYQKILGFELKYRLDDVGWCELSSSVERVNVGLSVVESPNPGGATPTFGVQDINAARASLESNNVRMDDDIVTIEPLSGTPRTVRAPELARPAKSGGNGGVESG